MDKKQAKLDKITQGQIDNYFNQLEVFISKLPLTKKIKDFIWFDTFIQFYDTLQETENGDVTYGIQTKWQLERFIEKFKISFHKWRRKRMESFIKEIDNLPPLEARNKINEQLHLIYRKEILAKNRGRATDRLGKLVKVIF